MAKNNMPMFSHIETRAKLRDGRVITSSYSNPLGYTKADYDRIDAALVVAFGNEGSSTTGTVGDFQQ
jgi:hypothetical protein